MRILEADIAIKDQVNAFYIEQGYHSDWSDTERAFVCLVDGEVVGSVKVELIHEVAILRGMYVDSSYQGNGIGTRLLKHIEPMLNERVAYCMPLSHVADYYKRIGFEEVPEAEYPEFLLARCQHYQDAGYSIRTMRRERTLYK